MTNQDGQTLEPSLAGIDGYAAHSTLNTWIMQAPAAMAILHGPEHVFQTANPRFEEVSGFRELLGKPVREVFPQLAGQSLLEMLDSAFRSGEPFIGPEVQGPPRREAGTGTQRDAYYNFVCQPVTSAGGTVEGIFLMAVDVSGQVLAGSSNRRSPRGSACMRGWPGSARHWR